MLIIVLLICFHKSTTYYFYYVFIVLFFVYALINGLYIQNKVNSLDLLQKNLEVEKYLSNLIVESVPTGIIIVKSNGVIEYVNESVGNILGSIETIGLNILEFNTVKESGLDKLINAAFLGKTNELRNLTYTSFTSHEKKVINFLIKPFRYNNELMKNDAMIIVDDITYKSYLNEKIKVQYFSMFRSFAKFIDTKDSYTGHHSSNVLKYVDKMLFKMDLDEKYKNEIKIAAALHDIGKIGINDSILNKAGKLSDEEYTKMKTHPTIGANLLNEIEDYVKISSIVRFHHERWDGKGYPDSLKGNNIPLGSQLIAIADSYDAITSDRIYRSKMTKTEALQILNNEKWAQFNGDFVDLFIKIIN